MNRYWGEDLSEPKQVLTLEALHELTQQRAKERRRAAKKRKLQNGKETDCIRTSEEEDASIRLKQVKLGCNEERKSKRKKRVKVQTEDTLEEKTKDSECNVVEKSTNEDLECDGTMEGSDEDSDIADRDNDNDGDDRNESSVTVAHSKSFSLEPTGVALSQDRIDPEGRDETVQSAPLGSASESENETTPPSLAPLSSGQPGGAGKKRVQRQLPEWILNPTVVENDIQKFSR